MIMGINHRHPTMNTPLPAFRSPAILSVRVFSMEAPMVFVVTENPSLADAVRKFLLQSNEHASVIWLTSVASACRRLEWDHAAMVIVDDIGDTAAESLATLQTAAPNTRVLVLAEDAVVS
jgi:hypothetical protein